VPAATPQPGPKEEILAVDMAALTDDDIPPDEDAWAVPDPDTGRPAELAGLMTRRAARTGRDRADAGC